MRKDEFPIVDKLVEEERQKARAEAFDEIIEFEEKRALCKKEPCPHLEDDSYGCARCIIEQMKEEKNG